MPQIDSTPENETMVLRTVYLPAALDEELKKLAFHGSTSKGDLIRRAIRKMVDGMEPADNGASTDVKP
jgi:predicted DNA-binding protein